MRLGKVDVIHISLHTHGNKPKQKHMSWGVPVYPGFCDLCGSDFQVDDIVIEARVYLGMNRGVSDYYCQTCDAKRKCSPNQCGQREYKWIDEYGSESLTESFRALLKEHSGCPQDVAVDLLKDVFVWFEKNNIDIDSAVEEAQLRNPDE